MDASLYPALKAGILAETDPVFVALRQAGSTGQMAIWLNQPHATVQAWKKAAAWVDVFDAIDGAKYTPTLAQVNASTDTASTNKLLVNLMKLMVQQNYLLAMSSIDARDSGTVDAILDSVSAVYTLNGTNTTSPGGLSGVNVANKMARPALRGEVIFGGEDVTKATVTAKVLAWEGEVTDNDVIQAVNLPG